MAAVKGVFISAGAALAHEFLLLEKHRRLRVLAFLTQQVFLNEPNSLINPSVKHYLTNFV